MGWQILSTCLFQLNLTLQMLCYLLEVMLTPENTPPDCPKELYELYFVFCCVWAFGGCLFQDQVSFPVSRKPCSLKYSCATNDNPLKLTIWNVIYFKIKCSNHNSTQNYIIKSCPVTNLGSLSLNNDSGINSVQGFVCIAAKVNAKATSLSDGFVGNHPT